MLALHQAVLDEGGQLHRVVISTNIPWAGAVEFIGTHGGTFSVEEIPFSYTPLK